MAITPPMRIVPFACLIFLGVTLTLAGCGKKAPAQQRNPTHQRLFLIGKAYGKACHLLGRPPKNLEELKPYLEPDVPADLFRSPNDGEPFVICWNLPYNQLGPGNDSSTVAAYEKTGSEGVRYVLRFPLQVLQMTDQEFANATFPPGQRPSR